MQRTQNYNLCQWAAEDRILRSDFNADNQKIDAALKAVELAAAQGPAREELITTVNVGTSSTALSISLSGIDWSKYQYVRLDMELVGTDANISVKPSGNSSSCTFMPLNGNSVSALGKVTSGSPCVMLLLCYHDPNRKLLASTISINGGISSSNSMTFQQLTGLVLTPSVESWPIQSGSVIKIYGII